MITAGSLVCRMMFFFALSTVIAASDHPTRAVYFAAITIFNAQAAVIEVTASSGGVGGTEPTYQFSDLSGTSVATLTGNVSNGDITASGDLIASGDVKTGSGNRVNDLAARLAAAEATISAMQQYVWAARHYRYAGCWRGGGSDQANDHGRPAGSAPVLTMADGYANTFAACAGACHAGGFDMFGMGCPMSSETGCVCRNNMGLDVDSPNILLQAPEMARAPASSNVYADNSTSGCQWRDDHCNNAYAHDVGKPAVQAR